MAVVFGFVLDAKAAREVRQGLPCAGPRRHHLGLPAARCCGPRSRAKQLAALGRTHGNTLINRSIVLNGLSAGAYSVGNTLLELDARGGRDAFYGRIKSAVYDCPVDFDGVPKGVSSAMLGEGTTCPKSWVKAPSGFSLGGRHGEVGKF